MSSSVRRPAIRPPSSSSPLAAEDHAAFCDGGERLWSSKPGAESPPSSAPSSRQPPSVDDRDHRAAMSHESCDGGDGARSSPASSSSASRCRRAASGSRSGLPAAQDHVSTSRRFAASASNPPCRREYTNTRSRAKGGERSKDYGAQPPEWSEEEGHETPLTANVGEDRFDGWVNSWLDAHGVPGYGK